MIRIEKIDKYEWAKMSEKAHLICFKELRAAHMDRIDFALLGVKDGIVQHYCTVKELDFESCYWQYGGQFPSAKDHLSVSSYKDMAEWCFNEGYKRVTTYIQNTNSAMMRIALKVGFIIVGVRYFHGEVYVEFLLEKNEQP